MKRLLILSTALLLVACAPTNAPNELVALGNARATGTSAALISQSTQAIATQSASDHAFNQALTMQALPAEQTATALALATQIYGLDLVRAQGTAISARATVAYTETQVALTLLESNKQKTLAENNRAIANSVQGGERWRNTLDALAGIAIGFVGVLAIWSLWQLALYIRTRRHIRETSDRWEALFEQERKMFEAKLYLTSAGVTSTAVTIAERHVAQYQQVSTRNSEWRGAIKAYIQSAINVGQNGEAQPFSEPTCIRHSLITDPGTGKLWVDGYRRIMRVLKESGCMTTRKGGKTDWADGWDYARFAREFDRLPLPPFPDGPIPRASITLRGSEVLEV